MIKLIWIVLPIAIPKIQNHRFLDHERGPNAPLNGQNLNLRAAVTQDGYCIEYRETKV